MSEVDRLSTSGTYPALPLAQKRRAKDDSPGPGSEERRSEGRETAGKAPGPPRSPRSLIDEYA